MDALSQAVGSVRVGAVAVRQLRLAAAWTLPLDSFAGTGFHMVTRGSCWLRAGDADAQPIEAGDVVVLPHGSAHVLSSASGSDVEILCGAYRLAREQPHPALSRLPKVLVIAGRDRHAELLETVELLRHGIDGAAPGADAIRRAVVDLFLVQALRAWQEDAGDASLAADGDSVVSRALTHIHTRPDAGWTAAGLARTVGLSRTAFTRRFTAEVGVPPMTYLTRRRMSIACDILRATDAPLSAVATRIGYSSEYSFAAAFRREIGVSPGRFRSQPSHSLSGRRGTFREVAPGRSSGL